MGDGPQAQNAGFANSGAATLVDVTAGAVAGHHGRRSLRVRVGPATEQQTNTIFSGLAPIACFDFSPTQRRSRT